MSEGMVTIAGTVIREPLRQHVTEDVPSKYHSDKTFAQFVIRTTPAVANGDAESFTTLVCCGGGIAEDALAKIDAGTRVVVQGRLGTHNRQTRVYAQIIGVDLRSVPAKSVSA